MGAYVLIAFCLFVIFLFVLYLFMVKPRKSKLKKGDSIIKYAHRGLHGDGVPENSLAAFEKAVEQGFGIELDVQLSKDGKVVVFHDYTLSRMTGVDEKLCCLNLSELTSLSLANTKEKIPTFEQVLTLVDGKVPLLVELKGEETDSSLCPKVAEILERYKGEYVIESFNPLLVRNAKKYLKNAPCGLLYTNVCRDKGKWTFLNFLLTIMAFNFLAKPDFIAYNKADRDCVPVKITTKLYKSPSFVWTIKGEEELDIALKKGETPIFEKK